jgi:hypothetical protein
MKYGVVALLATIVGATGAILFVSLRTPTVPKDWIQLSIERQGYGWTTEAITSEIEIPRVTPPKGRAKFLDRDTGIELGYLITVPIASLDLSKIPAKYHKPQKLASGFEIGPTEQVDYKAHFEFILKDADGFKLIAVSSDPVEAVSGQDNVFQSSANEKIPASVATRTKSIEMNLSLDKCMTCSTASGESGLER